MNGEKDILFFVYLFVIIVLFGVGLFVYTPKSVDSQVSAVQYQQQQIQTQGLIEQQQEQIQETPVVEPKKEMPVLPPVTIPSVDDSDLTPTQQAVVADIKKQLDPSALAMARETYSGCVMVLGYATCHQQAYDMCMENINDSELCNVLRDCLDEHKSIDYCVDNLG